MPRSGGKEGKLACSVSHGRSASYYLPPRYRERPVPVAVLLHDGGGTGRDMVQAFRQLAQAQRFAIVAPDSKVPWYWFPKFGAAGEDPAHVVACLAEALALPGVSLDAQRLLVAGFGEGGTFAPYIAFSTPAVTALAMLHAPLEENLLRLRNMPHVWYSGGKRDERLDYVTFNSSAAQLRLYCNLPSLTIKPRVAYPSKHRLEEREKKEVVAWWLASA
ncbi:hypothetical protein CHLNCDRAFT_140979 [Chlorella variabilis]|uniref:Phospholipase/carboxylesterase/thioesterase domain-containing protein n=1 Tax=Chlorella variabilis TaxID=554065 RepID=E1ZRX9_CHLVA|nr:hypothetical protein CHLNCDRAFT_140979 [Chlorella variabilis]EFN51381.1 hypothetical protein CHLNCDRAFT_140979 [Chlorella variabilis]|eukprot:XP_005843483.1 hypothetical protein CHLNCDRAFT_140979 [Chlorella variabilis]